VGLHIADDRIDPTLLLLVGLGEHRIRLADTSRGTEEDL
jgi:hypothetical protein